MLKNALDRPLIRLSDRNIGVETLSGGFCLLAQTAYGDYMSLNDFINSPQNVRKLSLNRIDPGFGKVGSCSAEKCPSLVPQVFQRRFSGR